MKKNKKLFLASIAAMGAVAIGTGAVSTFAWYVTGEAQVAFNAKAAESKITTTATATAANVQVDVVFSIALTDSLEPTRESDGKTLIVRNNTVALPASQPTEEKRIGDSATISVSHIYQHDTTTNLSAEDARSLKGQSFFIKLTAPNEAEGVRLNTQKTEVSDGFYKVANVAAGIVVGKVVFDSDNPEDPTKCTFTAKDGTGDSIETFYYSYNPKFSGDVGATQASSEEPEINKSITITASLSSTNP